MLHMIVMSHGPETCAAANESFEEMARYALAYLEETSKKLQRMEKSAWVDPPAHVFYLIVDEPDGHIINQAMQELKFMLWNTTDVHPIVTLEEALSLVAR